MVTDLDHLPPNYLPVLRHIGRYRLTLTEVVARHFVPTDPDKSDEERRSDRLSGAGVILRRLVNDGFLNHHSRANPEWPPLDNKVPYFTLTPEGARLTKVKVERSEVQRKKKKPNSQEEAKASGTNRVFGPDALLSALATLWFCTMNVQPRHRVEPEELERFFGEVKSFENVPHCLAKTKHGFRIYRVYTPAVEKMSAVVPGIRKVIDRVKEIPSVRPWAEQRDYGIAVLAPSRSDCIDINAAIERANLQAEMHLFPALGPTVETIADALKHSKPRD